MATNPARAEYLKQWRKNHPEKIREYNQRYWEKKFKEYLKKRDEKDGKTSAEHPLHL